MNSYPLINGQSRFDAVIVANGSYPQNKACHTLIQHASHLIVCDGAAQSLVNDGVEAHRMTVIGDGDSLPDSLKSRIHFIHVAEQDDNDLTKATRYLMSLSTFKEGAKVAYLGCTGKREDHTLGNISLMMRYYSSFHLQPIMITDHGYFIPTCGESCFKTFAHQQISIFNFGCKRLESEGLLWQSYAYDALWQGTLNEASGNEVTFHADGFYMVYLTFEGKVAEHPHQLTLSSDRE